MAPVRPNGSNNRSIKDFFRPSPPSKATLKKLREQSYDVDEECIIVEGTEDPTKQNTKVAQNTEVALTGQASPISSSIAARRSGSPSSLPLRQPSDLAIVTSISPAKFHASGTDKEPISISSSSSFEKADINNDATLDSSSSTFNQRSTPSMASSKRAVWNGQDVIRNSDDDTDDSLEELEDLLRPSKPIVPAKRMHTDPIITPVAGNGKGNLDEQRRTSLRSNTASTPSWSSSSKPIEKNKPRFSLAKLVKQSKEARASEARVAEINAKLQEDGTLSRISGKSRQEVTEATIAEVLGKGEENEGRAKRTIQAIQRTEALDYDSVWHFFDEYVQSPPHAEFPKQCLPQACWSAVVNTPSKRESAFKSGFVARIASRTALPPELLQWMLDEICAETREDLVHAYLNSLEASTKHSKNIIAGLITPEELCNLFSRLGARAVTLSPYVAVVPDRQPLKTSTRKISPNVRWTIDLLRRIASSLSNDATEFAIQLIIRMSFDETVLGTGSLRILIENALAALISSLPDSKATEILSGISSNLFETIKSPILRYRLITSLPLNTARTHLFRRRLALAFVLDTARHLNSSMSNEAMTAHTVLHIKESPVYRITHTSDYHAIAACLKMLDVGIDAGFSDLAFLPPATSSSLPSSSSSPSSSPSSPSAPLPSNSRHGKEPETEAAFNASVDLLASAVRDIQSRIVAGGASHISRLEAKGTADRVAQRLDSAVRTELVRAKDWYAEKEEGAGHDGVGKAFMERWVGIKAEDGDVDMIS